MRYFLWALALSLLGIFYIYFSNDEPLYACLPVLAAALLVAPPVRVRLRRYYPSALAVALLIGACILIAKHDDAEAMRLGFASSADYLQAKERGLASQNDLALWRDKEKQKEADEANYQRMKKLADAGAADRDADQRQQAASSDADTCRSNLHCWGEKYGIEASFACRSKVERLAKYQFEWTDGWLGLKFGHYKWNDAARGVITYVGDKIKFQNVFGAWENETYSCDYDPSTKTVLNVDAVAGRLPE